MIVTVPLIGRFGNQMFQYAYARAYAEQCDAELRTLRWIGEKIFQIELTKEPDGTETVLGGYAQNQDALIYTRKQVRQWFSLRPEIESQLRDVEAVPVTFHRRTGDYAPLGYVVVSLESYFKAAVQFGYGGSDIAGVRIVSADEPLRHAAFTAELEWLPDFYRMMKSTVLFRANSTFSWWAGTLGEGIVYSPVVNGLHGGREQDCEFVLGNWPRFANLPNITDLHLNE